MYFRNPHTRGWGRGSLCTVRVLAAGPGEEAGAVRPVAHLQQRQERQLGGEQRRHGQRLEQQHQEQPRSSSTRSSVQLRTCISLMPNFCVSTLYCTSSCPVGATMLLWPASASQSMKRSHAAQSCQTSV